MRIPAAARSSYTRIRAAVTAARHRISARISAATDTSSPRLTIPRSSPPNCYHSRTRHRIKSESEGKRGLPIAFPTFACSSIACLTAAFNRPAFESTPKRSVPSGTASGDGPRSAPSRKTRVSEGRRAGTGRCFESKAWYSPTDARIRLESRRTGALSRSGGRHFAAASRNARTAGANPVDEANGSPAPSGSLTFHR